MKKLSKGKCASREITLRAFGSTLEILTTELDESAELIRVVVPGQFTVYFEPGFEPENLSLVETFSSEPVPVPASPS